MNPNGSPPADARAARLRELRALADGGATPQELAIHLAALGYDPERAAGLLDQLAQPRASDEPDPRAGSTEPDRPTPLDDVDDPGGPALRVWAPFERARFSPEAWGRLLRLRHDGMGDAEFEHLVDRALLQLDGAVGIAELRTLLGDTPDADSTPTVH
ncbi:MAG TPA: hypothetical protein VGD56_02785 [Gemmatirosa sp.]